MVRASLHSVCERVGCLNDSLPEDLSAERRDGFDDGCVLREGERMRGAGGGMGHSRWPRESSVDSLRLLPLGLLCLLLLITKRVVWRSRGALVLPQVAPSREGPGLGAAWADAYSPCPQLLLESGVVSYAVLVAKVCG